MARDIILNLAISLDGFICDEDGGFAWISGQGDVRADTADHFDFDGFLASCDTIVMGRKAYEDFIRADAVDRYIVGILPVIRGKGRRLFQEGIPPVELHLDRCTVSDGIPILEYSRRGR